MNMNQEHELEEDINCVQTTPEESNGEKRNLSHQEVVNLFHEKLDEMLGDPLLCDLRPDVTTEEVNSLTALEYGQAMTIEVVRGDGETYTVIVNQNATVGDFKRAVKRHFALKMQREDGPKHISWRYIWKTYWLYFQGQKLKEDNKHLKEYGLRNKDQVTFVKRLKEK